MAWSEIGVSSVEPETTTANGLMDSRALPSFRLNGKCGLEPASTCFVSATHNTIHQLDIADDSIRVDHQISKKVEPSRVHPTLSSGGKSRRAARARRVTTRRAAVPEYQGASRRSHGLVYRASNQKPRPRTVWMEFRTLPSLVLKRQMWTRTSELPAWCTPPTTVAINSIESTTRSAFATRYRRRSNSNRVNGMARPSTSTVK
jgi:hypothetical protein